MNSRGIFWGTLLILGGVFFLLKQTGILFFHIDWLIWKKLWPLFLILIGIRLILPRENKVIGIVLLVSVVLVFGYSVYEGIQLKHSFMQGGSDGNFSFPSPKSDEDSNDSDDNSRDSSSNPEASGTLESQKFSVPLASEIKQADLKLEGGAAEFTSDFTHSSLFEASTQIDESSAYRLERSTQGNTEQIKLLSANSDHHWSFNDKDNKNEVKIRLNPDVVWNMDLNIGAGKVDYDFSGYKIQDLNFDSGLCSVNLKLGRLNPITHVNVEAGLASFHLLVPKSSGCKIHMDGALSSKNFNGFQKIDDENYKTSNYETADRKIDIHISGGISEISINPY